MKTLCHCNGRSDVEACSITANSLRRAIGGFRCVCGSKLTNEQVLLRLLSRIEDLETQHLRCIEAFVAMDWGECDKCGRWFKDAELICAGDRATCPACFDLEYFVRESDDDETVDHVLPELMRRIVGTPYMKQIPKERDGTLMEPFLSEYKKATREAQ